MNSFQYSGGKALKFSALLVELSLETMFSLLVPFGLAYFFGHVLFVFSSAVVLLIPYAVLPPAFALCYFPSPPFCPPLPLLDLCTSFSLYLYPCCFLYWVLLFSSLFLLYPDVLSLVVVVCSFGLVFVLLWWCVEVVSVLAWCWLLPWLRVSYYGCYIKY